MHLKNILFVKITECLEVLNLEESQQLTCHMHLAVTEHQSLLKRWNPFPFLCFGNAAGNNCFSVSSCANADNCTGMVRRSNCSSSVFLTFNIFLNPAQCWSSPSCTTAWDWRSVYRRRDKSRKCLFLLRLGATQNHRAQEAWPITSPSAD